MPGMFWNPRGLGEQEKRDFLVEYFCDHKLRFVGLHETKIRSISANLLNGFSGSNSFSWAVAASNWQSGGVSLGVNNDYYEIIDSEIGRFHTRMFVKDVEKNMVLNIVNIYGAPHAKDKQDFLIELLHAFSCNSFPFLVGGDFNIIRKK